MEQTIAKQYDANGKFKGFHATTDKGTPCYVINVCPDNKRYKVQLGTMGRYHGWNGEEARRDVHYNGRIGWILKSKIARGKKR